MFEILPQSEGGNLAIKASGIISESDYEAVLPEFERRIEKVPRFRLMVDWERVEGWEAGADSVTFGVRFMHRLHLTFSSSLSDLGEIYCGRGITA